MRQPAIDINSIVETLRLRILNGDYTPGTKLSENSLAKEFSCSRTPIREALKQLNQDNLVTILPHSGTYVHKRTYKEHIEVTEIRAALESLAFRLASENNASPAMLSMICDQMDSQLLRDTPVDYDAYGKTHYLFHRQLIELSSNELLISLYDRLNLNNASELFGDKMTKENRQFTQDEHHAIVKALADRDTEAGESFIFNHLWRKRSAIMKKHKKQTR